MHDCALVVAAFASVGRVDVLRGTSATRFGATGRAVCGAGLRRAGIPDVRVEGGAGVRRREGRCAARRPSSAFLRWADSDVLRSC